MRLAWPLRRLSGARLALLVGLGLLLVRLALALTVPLGAAPDERDHFIKAFGAARLDFGDTSGVRSIPPTNDMERLNISLRVRIDMDSHAFNPTWACNNFRVAESSSCLDPDANEYPRDQAVTNFGTFQPYLYVVIGAPSLFVRDPDSAMFAMRLVIVIWTSLFTTFGLVVAVRRFGNRGLLASLVGWTPMVLYTNGTLGTSGIETASAFAAYLSALDVLSDGGPRTRGSRGVLIASVVSLSLSRPLSVFVVFVVVVLVVLTVGRRQTWRTIVALPRSYSAAAAVLGIGAIAANLGWSYASPPVFRGPDIGFMTAVGHYSLVTLPDVWEMVIGLFEWLDTELPFMVLVAAWVAICSVLAWSSPGRDRAGSLRLWFLIAATIAFGFIADYTVFARVGGALQGRHLLPLFQLWPLVALLPGQASKRLDADDGMRMTPLRTAALVMGIATAISWLYIARREAVGTFGPLNFFGRAAWHPPAGWIAPVALLVVGVLLSYLLPVVAGLASNPGRDDDRVRAERNDAS